MVYLRERVGVVIGVSVGPAIDALRKKKSQEHEDNDEKE